MPGESGPATRRVRVGGSHLPRRRSPIDASPHARRAAAPLAHACVGSRAGRAPPRSSGPRLRAHRRGADRGGRAWDGRGKPGARGGRGALHPVPPRRAGIRPPGHGARRVPRRRNGHPRAQRARDGRGADRDRRVLEAGHGRSSRGRLRGRSRAQGRRSAPRRPRPAPDRRGAPERIRAGSAIGETGRAVAAAAPPAGPSPAAPPAGGPPATAATRLRPRPPPLRPHRPPPRRGPARPSPTWRSWRSRPWAIRAAARGSRA